MAFLDQRRRVFYDQSMCRLAAPLALLLSGCHLIWPITEEGPVDGKSGMDSPGGSPEHAVPDLQRRNDARTDGRRLDGAHKDLKPGPDMGKTCTKVTLDTAMSWNDLSTSGPTSWIHPTTTCTPPCVLLVALAVKVGKASTVTYQASAKGPTFSLTLIAPTAPLGAGTLAEMWALKDPSPSAQATITVTGQGTLIGLVASSAWGCANAAVTTSSCHQSLNQSVISQSHTMTAGQVVVDVMSTNLSTSGVPKLSASQVQLWQDKQPSTGLIGASSYALAGTGGTFSLGWYTSLGTADWARCWALLGL